MRCCLDETATNSRCHVDVQRQDAVLQDGKELSGPSRDYLIATHYSTATSATPSTPVSSPYLLFFY